MAVKALKSLLSNPREEAQTRGEARGEAGGSARSRGMTRSKEDLGRREKVMVFQSFEGFCGSVGFYDRV